MPHNWVAVKQDKNNLVGTQSKDLYYIVDVLPSQATAPVLLSTLNVHTIFVFNSLSDYVTSEREPLPTWRVVHLSEFTPPYHMVNIFDEDDRILLRRFRSCGLSCMFGFKLLQKGTSMGHFVSFHRRGDYYYVFGGEMNARPFKIHERHIATVFWEHHSVLLQLLRGDSWHARCSSSLSPVFGTSFLSRTSVPTGQGY